MRKQVLTYVKPAKELAAGDRVLTNRMTVASVEKVEAFTDSSERACVEAHLSDGGAASVAVFVAADMVMVLE